MPLYATRPSFLHGYWRLNSSPHACTARKSFPFLLKFQTLRTVFRKLFLVFWLFSFCVSVHFCCCNKTPLVIWLKVYRNFGAFLEAGRLSSGCWWLLVRASLASAWSHPAACFCAGARSPSLLKGPQYTLGVVLTLHFFPVALLLNAATLGGEANI